MEANMGEGVSEVEENNLRVLLAMMRKHAPEALERIIFDVLLFGLANESALVMIKGEEDDELPTDNPTVEATVIAIRGKENTAKFFKALQDAGLDEAEDTQIS
jgi:hypothetical protein